MDRQEAQDQARKALENLDALMDAFAEVRLGWEQIGREVRELDLHTWHRVDAYPGWHLTRDAGAGVDIEGWMEEVKQVLQDVVDAEDPTPCPEPGCIVEGLNDPDEMAAHLRDEHGKAMFVHKDGTQEQVLGVVFPEQRNPFKEA